MGAVPLPAVAAGQISTPQGVQFRGIWASIRCALLWRVPVEGRAAAVSVVRVEQTEAGMPEAPTVAPMAEIPEARTVATTTNARSCVPLCSAPAASRVVSIPRMPRNAGVTFPMGNRAAAGL